MARKAYAGRDAADLKHNIKAETCTSRVVYRSNNNANANGGVAYANANNDSSNTNANIGSRLANIKFDVRKGMRLNTGYNVLTCWG